MSEKYKCDFCGADSEGRSEYGFRLIKCSNCGGYIVSDNFLTTLNEKKHIIGSYIFHHKTHNDSYFIGNELQFKDYQASYPQYIYTKFVSIEVVENWYPKTFEERINYALLYLANNSKYVGDATVISVENFSSLFFFKNPLTSNNWSKELTFTLKYLYDQKLVVNDFSAVQLYDYIVNLELKGKATFTLSAKAWSKVYDLQKSQSNNKNVFVAMKFGEDTKELRDKIKEGLSGYEVRIMDEIEHNRQIVPEMLYEIKNSRFVVAELSHHNNGAYYEAGYALGLGKEVIHICSESERNSGLHFDVAQVNTIFYNDISEIPERLKKRIKATIENK